MAEAMVEVEEDIVILTEKPLCKDGTMAHDWTVNQKQVGHCSKCDVYFKFPAWGDNQTALGIPGHTFEKRRKRGFGGNTGKGHRPLRIENTLIIASADDEAVEAPEEELAGIRV